MSRSSGFLLFVCLVFASAAPAQRAAIHELTVRSSAIAGNLLGVPAEQRVTVYVPPDYEASTTRRYPALYLLHGIGGSSGDWTEELQLAALVDRLIAAKRIEPMLIVMPNAMTPYGGSFYVDSPVGGGWEDFLTRELIAAVDGRYRTRRNAASRAIAGHSMGGFGAIRLGSAHPELYGGLYALSPCCLDLVEDLGHANQEWRDTLGFTSHDDIRRSIAARRFYPVSLLAIAAALSPNPAKPPFYVDFPVRLEGGELVLEEAVARRWRAAMPVAQVQARAENLLALQTIYVDYGVGEQFAHIPAGVLRYSAALGAERVPHTIAAYRGDHRNAVAERLEHFVLPLVSDQFGGCRDCNGNAQ